MRPGSNHSLARRLMLTFAMFCTAAALSVRASALDLVGYLPYYRMNASYNANVLPAQLAMLDEIRYFGLTAASNGMVVPLGGSGSFTTNENRILTIKNAIEQLPASDRPRLNITLGGAGEAASFATIAASESLRSTFARDINSLLDHTGATSVDIDWEHPQGNSQMNDYRALLQQIKQEVGPDRRVYATIAPSIGLSPTVLAGPNGIDGTSLMTYDLSWWANASTDLNRGEHSLPEYVEDAVEAWTQPAESPNQRPYVFGTWGRGAPAEQLGVGLPFYGRAIGTSESPQGGATYTYSQLVADGNPDEADPNYYSYQGQTVWIPGPELVEQRVQFAHDRSLKSIIIWEIGQDLPASNPDSLLRRAYETNQSLLDVVGDYDDDGDVDMDDYHAWTASFGLTGDLPADGNGDGVVIGADYVIWRNALPGSSGALAVPGLAGWSMLVVGAMLVGGWSLSRGLSRKRLWL